MEGSKSTIARFFCAVFSISDKSPSHSSRNRLVPMCRPVSRNSERASMPGTGTLARLLVVIRSLAHDRSPVISPEEIRHAFVCSFMDNLSQLRTGLCSPGGLKCPDFKMEFRSVNCILEDRGHKSSV